MSATYNLRSLPKGWQVNKFDDDFNLESSYEMTLSDGEVRCGCPAGQRPSCRHRQMFPMLQTRVDTAWFLDFDTRAWVDPTGEAKAAGSMTIIDDVGPVDWKKAASAASSSDSSLAEAKAYFNAAPPSPVETTFEQDVATGHTSRIDEEANAACAPNRDEHPFRRRM